MRRSSIICLGLVALLSALLPATAGAFGASYGSEGAATGFSLDGSNGYSIFVYAYSERADGQGRITISVDRKGESAFYSAPAEVTATKVFADLGRLGTINATLHLSGHEKTVPFCGRLKVPFEPGYYEGTLKFRGEGGYVQADQTRAPLSPFPFPRSGCHGGGSGEELNSPDLPGARLRALSFAGGRILSLQVNKNRPKAPAFYSVNLRERRDGVKIKRAIEGKAPASAFAFTHDLGTATLRPPSPFSGTASIARSEDSFSPLWAGDLAVDLPGRPEVPLAGPGVHVSLVHARFTRSRGPHAHI